MLTSVKKMIGFEITLPPSKETLNIPTECVHQCYPAQLINQIYLWLSRLLVINSIANKTKWLFCLIDVGAYQGALLHQSQHGIFNLQEILPGRFSSLCFLLYGKQNGNHPLFIDQTDDVLDTSYQYACLARGDNFTDQRSFWSFAFG